MKRPERKEYQFTLTLDGPDELTIDRMNRLFETGCDDATFGTRCGVHFAMFHRKAGSPTEAILSAIEDVEERRESVFEARSSRTSSLVRTGASRTVAGGHSAWRGHRPGGFPLSVAGLQQKSPLYRWSDVAAWLDRIHNGSKQFDTTEADAIAFLNAALDVRRFAPGVPAMDAIRRRKQAQATRSLRCPVVTGHRLSLPYFSS